MECNSIIACYITTNNKMSQFMKVTYRIILKISVQKILFLPV